MNLLQETLASMNVFDQTSKDVSYLMYDTEQGPSSFTWTDFVSLADIEYDAGYGLQEIEPSLRIIFNDGSYMYRKEYDGSEWWAYESGPKARPPYQKPESLRNY